MNLELRQNVWMMAAARGGRNIVALVNLCLRPPLPFDSHGAPGSPVRSLHDRAFLLLESQGETQGEVMGVGADDGYDQRRRFTHPAFTGPEFYTSKS